MTERRRNHIKRQDAAGFDVIKGRPEIFFLVMAAVLLLYHLLIREQILDDIYYSTVLNDGALGDVLKLRYETWSSRTLIEAVLIFFAGHRTLWKVADMFFLLLAAFLMGRVTGERRFSYAALLLFPFHELSQAGWVATTVNYIWPLGCGMVVCYWLRQCAAGKNPSWPHYLYSAVAVVFACNHEQMAAVMVMLTAYCLVANGVSFFSGQKKSDGGVRGFFLYPAVMLLLEGLSLFYIMRCPGNALRNEVSIAEFAPEFANWGVGTKSLMGVYNVARVLIAKPHVLYLSVITILFVLVYRRTDRFFTILVSSLPLLLAGAYAVAGPAMKGWGMVFCELPETTDVASLGIRGYLAVLYVAVVIGSMTVSLWTLLGDDVGCFLSTLAVVGAGFLSAAMLGFSPTIYASGNRIFIFFYFSLIYMAAVCIEKAGSGVGFSAKDRQILTAVGALWIAANVINECAHIIF